MRYESFGKVLKVLLDESQLFNRHDWAYVLGTSLTQIQQWLDDVYLPRPEDLYMIIRSIDRSCPDYVPAHIQTLMEELLMTRLDMLDHGPIEVGFALRRRVITFGDYAHTLAFNIYYCPLDHSDLTYDAHELIKKLIRLKEAIRTVRDMRGDNRCHLDILIAFREVPGIPIPDRLPCQEAFLADCDFYIAHCQEPFPNVQPECTEPQNDYYVFSLTTHELRNEIMRLRELLWELYQKGSNRKAQDYKKVYNTLRDKVIYDTRLPDGIKANCIRFYAYKAEEQRQNGTCNLHEW